MKKIVIVTRHNTAPLQAACKKIWGDCVFTTIENISSTNDWQRQCLKDASVIVATLPLDIQQSLLETYDARLVVPRFERIEITDASDEDGTEFKSAGKTYRFELKSFDEIEKIEIKKKTIWTE